MLYLSTRSKVRAALIATATLLASPAFAREGSGHAMSLVSGVAHPLLGLDHLLAMLAVGLWAAHYPKPVRWVLPLVLLAVMALGAVAGMMEMPLPGAEPGISGSVAVLGLLIACAVRMPVWAGGIAVSLFALVHGYAHGMELPAGASPAMYGVGFVLAAFALNMVGMAFGSAATGKAAAKAMRVVGVAIAASGTWLLVGA